MMRILSGKGSAAVSYTHLDVYKRQVVSSPMYGPITFDTVEKILAGEEIPAETIMEGAVVDSDNAEENMHLAY